MNLPKALSAISFFRIIRVEKFYRAPLAIERKHMEIQTTIPVAAGVDETSRQKLVSTLTASDLLL